jgi:hypothetical protein
MTRLRSGGAHFNVALRRVIGVGKAQVVRAGLWRAHVHAFHSAWFSAAPSPPLDVRTTCRRQPVPLGHGYSASQFGPHWAAVQVIAPRRTGPVHLPRAARSSKFDSARDGHLTVIQRRRLAPYLRAGWPVCG